MTLVSVSTIMYRVSECGRERRGGQGEGREGRASKGGREGEELMALQPVSTISLREEGNKKRSDRWREGGRER